jgi:putative YphP/YqiW family bacilliredoxin
MRAELTRLGVEETRTPAQVDQFLAAPGSAMIVINSMCGCAAGRARPGVAMALRHAVTPARSATVFAGGDEAATAHLRKVLKDFPPSSPSIALFQDGKPVAMIHRHEIERREAPEIAALLTAAFDKHFAAAAKA